MDVSGMLTLDFSLYATVVFALLPATATANWMYLGLLSSLGTVQREDSACGPIPGLETQQIQMCKKNPQSVPCIGEGARKGISECHYQFKFERWNCTTVNNQSVFGPVLSQGTKETAFIYAITSAGVVHAVTQSCSAGNLTDCTCDMSYEGESVDGWKWGGCSDNIKYGVWFGKTFVDAPDKTAVSYRRRAVREMMNLHNNEVGRKAIADQMTLQCRCHGVSGSCAVKTCWKNMPSFRQVGDILKEKYETAVEVAPRSRRKLRRRSKRDRKLSIGDDELVHISPSPNYCRRDASFGLPGTRGRECKKESSGADSCDLLCCGRGYNTEVVRYVERCHCKFIWCCYVKCKTCETMLDRHTCK